MRGQGKTTENISAVVLAQAEPGTLYIKSGTLLVEPTCSVAFRHGPLYEGARARPFVRV